MKSIVWFCIFALFVGNAYADADESGAPKMPSLKVQTLDGGAFELSAQKGKWVIVNYWATWCGPCVKEMPALSAFVAAHDDVTAIGLAFEDTDRADLEAFLKKRPVSYPIAQVDIDNPPLAFDVPRGLPMTYVIAPDGSIAKQFVGPINEKDLAKVTGHALDQSKTSKP
ncbi:MAG: TlpA disulfide reductase family protein [Dokdonella sp.]